MSSNLIACRIHAKDAKLLLRANMAAISDYTLYALSAVGAGQEIRAAAAALRAGDRASFEMPIGPHFIKGDGKYAVRYTKLAFDHWHMLGISVNRRFILNCTDDALWNLFRSDAFTTPLLRSWIPCLRHELKMCGLLKRVSHAHNCNPWFCCADEAQLDAIVAEGVKSGRLKMEESA